MSHPPAALNAAVFEHSPGPALRGATGILVAVEEAGGKAVRAGGHLSSRARLAGPCRCGVGVGGAGAGGAANGVRVGGEGASRAGKAGGGVDGGVGVPARGAAVERVRTGAGR